ncbi:MAG: autotransporter-associated beta strand repeat-containing protein, partial [Saprospiraceae bacterium]
GITTVTGILRNDATSGGTLGTISNSSTTNLIFASGGTYENAVASGTIPIATWNPASNCKLVNGTTSMPSNLNQSFGNLIFNSSGFTGTPTLPSTGLTIAGDFQVINVGTGTLQLNQTPLTIGGNCTLSDDFKIGTGGSTKTLNVTGNLLIDGGNITIAGSNAIHNLTVTGSTSITGGTLTISTTGTGNFNVNGDFSFTAGTITKSSGNANIIFGKTGIQSYTSGTGTIGTIAFTANSGSILQMAAESTTVDGTGSFTLASSATLGITSNAGVSTSGATGNIRTTSRTYTAGSNFLYNGSANQSAGSGLAATTKANVTIDNPGHTVTLEGNTLLTGALTLTASSNLALSIFNIGSATANTYPTSVNMKCGATTASTISCNSPGTLFFGGNISVTDATTGTNGATISCPITLNGNSTITVEDDGTSAPDFTASGIIGGSTFGITKEGTGKMALSNANTYTGATTINAGILSAQNNTATGTIAGGVTVTSGAKLELENNITVGAEALTLTGEGGAGNEGALCNVSGTNIWGGAITINAAPTRIGSASGLLTLSNTVNLGSYTLYIQGASTSANLISGIISGAGGSLIKEGTGTWSLSNSNGFTGGVTLSNGKLNINNANALGTTAGTFTIGGAGNSTTIDNTTASPLTLLNYPMNWNDDFIFTGTQSLNLGTGNVALQENRQVDVSASNLTVGGVISGSGFSLTKNGSGALTLSGTNTFTGGTVLNGGTLNINNSNALGTAAGTFVINGGIIDNTTASSITTLNYPMAWNDDFAFTGTRSLNLGTGAVTMQESRNITTNANTLSVGGTISGSGLSLTKSGAGTLTLSGANDYSGGTTLNAGTLNINNSNALGTTAGTFTINGGVIDNTSGADITTGNYPLALNADFTYSGSNPYNLNLGTGTTTLNANRQITVSAGTLTLGGTINHSTLNLTKAGSGELSFAGNDKALKNLTINAGALTATAGVINLAGDFVNNNVFNHNNGKIKFNGSSAQLMNGTTASIFYDLEIDNTNGVSLGNNESVNNQLTLANGRITLGTKILTLGSSAPAVAGTLNASNMIVADGSGEVRKVISGTGSYTFPVGDVTGTVEYSPLSLNFTAGTFSSAYAGVKLSDDRHPNDASTANFLSRYWKVNPSGISSFSCDVTGQYVDADINGTETNIITAKWNGSSPWQKFSLVDDGSNLLIANGVTGFSEFSGIDNSDPTVTISIDPASAIICSGASATLTATGADGTPGYTYSWSPAIG